MPTRVTWSSGLGHGLNPSLRTKTHQLAQTNYFWPMSQQNWFSSQRRKKVQEESTRVHVRDITSEAEQLTWNCHESAQLNYFRRQSKESSIDPSIHPLLCPLRSCLSLHKRTSNPSLLSLSPPLSFSLWNQSPVKISFFLFFFFSLFLSCAFDRNMLYSTKSGKKRGRGEI